MVKTSSDRSSRRPAKKGSKPELWGRPKAPPLRGPNTKLAERLKDFVDSFLTRKSVGHIQDIAAKNFRKAASGAVDASRLPKEPELWTLDFRGKPPEERDKALLLFLDIVYGPFMTAFRDEIREYIYKNDRKLYRAILSFGFENLPKRLQMPSRPQKVQKRLLKAVAGKYSDLTSAEKRSVRGFAARTEKPSPKN